MGIITAAELKGTNGYFNKNDKNGDGFDISSDMYSIGCILFEMYTGQVLIDFLGNKDVELGKHRRNIQDFDISSDDFNKVKEELEKATGKSSFVKNDNQDYVGKFLKISGLEELPLDLPELIVGLLDLDRTKRPNIDKTLEAYKYWQAKQLANDNFKTLKTKFAGAKVSGVSVDMHKAASGSPTYPLSAIKVGEVSAVTGINLEEFQQTHLYIANLKVAGASSDLMDEAKKTFGALISPKKAPTSSLPESSPAFIDLLKPLDVGIKEVEISQEEEKFDNERLDQIKSLMNNAIYSKYEKGKDSSDTKKNESDYLKPTHFSGIGVNFEKPIFEEDDKNHKYCVFKVVSVAVGGPAQIAGLKEGDKIKIRIEGNSTSVADNISIDDEVKALQKLRTQGVTKNNGITVDNGSRTPKINEIPTAVLNYSDDPIGKLEDFGFSQIKERAHVENPVKREAAETGAYCL